jgi:hypothetical protein
MCAIPGRCYVETDKGIHLWCISVSRGHVNLAYERGGTIAVCLTVEDFGIFFELSPDEAVSK